MTRGGLSILCVVIYGKTRVICNNLVIHIRTNKIFEEHAVFLHSIGAGVNSTFMYI